MNTESMPVEHPMTQDRASFAAHVYSSLPEAITELRKRQTERLFVRDRTLSGGPLPAGLLGYGPVGVLFRQVGSANYETRRVIREANRQGLPLVVMEFHDDRFMTRNRDKYALGRPGFYGGLGRNGGRRVEYVPLFDLDEMNGHPLASIRIVTGERLIDFHHRLLAAECPELPASKLCDCSAWFRARGETAADYYTSFVSLFLQHAILFETFVLDGAEREFTERVFLPAFDKLWKQTGLKPLIVPAEQEDWEGDDFWQLYPERLRVHLGPARIHDQIAAAGGPSWETPDKRESVEFPMTAARASGSALNPRLSPKTDVAVAERYRRF